MYNVIVYYKQFNKCFYGQHIFLITDKQSAEKYAKIIITKGLEIPITMNEKEFYPVNSIGKVIIKKVLDNA